MEADQHIQSVRKPRFGEAEVRPGRQRRRQRWTVGQYLRETTSYRAWELQWKAADALARPVLHLDGINSDHAALSALMKRRPVRLGHIAQGGHRPYASMEGGNGQWCVAVMLNPGQRIALHDPLPIPNDAMLWIVDINDITNTEQPSILSVADVSAGGGYASNEKASPFTALPADAGRAVGMLVCGTDAWGPPMNSTGTPA